MKVLNEIELAMRRKTRTFKLVLKIAIIPVVGLELLLVDPLICFLRIEQLHLTQGFSAKNVEQERTHAKIENKNNPTDF